MLRVSAMTLLVTLLLFSNARGEAIDGKVYSINLQTRQIQLSDTGIGKKGMVLLFDINLDAYIEEEIGDKLSPLPNGLKDIKVGDSVYLARSSLSVTYVRRLKTVLRKP